MDSYILPDASSITVEELKAEIGEVLTALVRVKRAETEHVTGYWVGPLVRMDFKAVKTLSHVLEAVKSTKDVTCPLC